MAELANCENCNRVFVKTMRTICPRCFEEEEKAFEIVYHFLRQRKNRQATLMEIVEATGVEEKLIIKFIKQQRLRTSQFPNLSYPCEKCGAPIQSGRICEECSKSIVREYKQQEYLEKLKSEKEEVNTYYTLDKHKKQ